MNELSTVLTEELNLPSVSEALPPDFNKARFVQNCLSLAADSNFQENVLSKYPQSKVVPGLLKGAYLGLDFFNKECYLIPYGSDLQFTTDYKGMVKLVKKYSIKPVAEIYARIVREGDEFTEQIVENSQSVTFKPKPFNDGKIIGAFAVCQYTDGTAKVETMTLAQLDTAKRMSKAQTGTAWKFFPDRMYLKIVIRRLCVGIPIDLTAKQASIFREEDSPQKTVIEAEENPF